MPDPRRWLVLAIAASGLFLICVDLTVLYVALPALTRDLAASNSARLWVLNAYPIVVAGLLPGLGTLGDRHGHRRLFLIGLATFGVASLAAAYSPSAALLIAARAFLGVGAAMMMPATLAIIRATFSDARERAFAIGLWSGIAAGGMALGPLIAGLLLEHYWWGSVFLINVPVVAVALLLTLWLVPAPRCTRRRAMGPDRFAADPGRAHIPGVRDQGSGASAAFGAGDSHCTAARLRIRCRIPAPSGATRAPAHRPVIVPAAGFHRCLCRCMPGHYGCGGPGAGIEPVPAAEWKSAARCRRPSCSCLWPLPVSSRGRWQEGSCTACALQRWPAVHSCLRAVCVLALALTRPDATHYPAIRLVLLVGMGLGIGASVTFASSTIMNAAPPERGGMAASIEEVGFETGQFSGCGGVRQRDDSRLCHVAGIA